MNWSIFKGGRGNAVLVFVVQLMIAVPSESTILCSMGSIFCIYFLFFFCLKVLLEKNSRTDSLSIVENTWIDDAFLGDPHPHTASPRYLHLQTPGEFHRQGHNHNGSEALRNALLSELASSAISFLVSSCGSRL
jgi:hypothetical protein